MFGGEQVQQLFHELYETGVQIACTCHPDSPVLMHLRRLNVDPPTYTLSTNPRYRHSSDCPRYHVYRKPSFMSANNERKTNVLPAEVNVGLSTATEALQNETDAVQVTVHEREFFVPTLEQLNEAQREAAMHKDGPCIVVAAAGSGKTAMLIARIQFLIESGVEPSRILACTFTQKAKDEMHKRLLTVAGGVGKAVTIGTIHSVAYRMLDPEIRSEWKVISDPGKLIDQVLENPSNYNPHGVGRIMKTADAILAITKAKADGLLPEQVEEPLAKVYAAYEALKTERKQLDFEDLLLNAVRKFQTETEFAEKWCDRWDYVLVDEFQDTNVSQWRFLQEVVSNSQNLFVVGDDFQSIYSFRGSRPALMGEFVRQFPTARIVLLTTNYRSHDLIVDLGNRVIELNRGHQIDKRVIAHRAMPDHAIAQVVVVKTDTEEARFVASEIAQLRKLSPDTPMNEYAILYRTNIQSRLYEEALAELEIPYQVVGDSHFYEHRDVKVLLDYLRTTHDTSDSSMWGPLMNRPKRFIPYAVVKEVVHVGWDAMTQHPKCRPFVVAIEGLRKHQEPAAAIRWLVETQPGVIPQQDDDEPIKWVDSLIASAARHSTIPEFLRYVDWILERSKTPQQDAVQLLTIHRSKGLEYQTVFVVGLAEGLLPHKNATTSEAMREETRLCYVGITRAEDNLYLLAAETYGEKDRPLSRFVRVLQE